MFLLPSVTEKYFFIVWFSNVNTYKCIWLSKSFAVELDDSLHLAWEAYTSNRWKKQYSFNGSHGRSKCVTFEKGLFWEHFHSRQTPCAFITLMCTCPLTYPTKVIWVRSSSSFSNWGPLRSIRLICPWLLYDLPFPSAAWLPRSLK